ncbi:cGMP-dependent protein kinase, isozyme 1 [Exaiptasia diaphana]|uniref:Cyclic nucleotide-binding domain-containing protein n=1 Tax=Exaiptasia diaphana TaxID=2652724 RepID=A0A913XZI4_EXADI|nr:cGMP-dependent protein kinase, isozyme 1 [Exaiptasia diaphana]KXJ23735.1 cGMP-dependent protein kinase, isozyme 1 [Exaiptasia diaphana]
MGNAPSSEQEVNVPARTTKTSSALSQEARTKFQNWLEKFPFDLKSPQIQSVLNASRVLDVESSKVLLRKGEIPAGLYVVVSGKFEVLSEGENFVLREIGEGDCFGEVSVMYNTKCTATVRAISRSTVIQLKTEDARRLFTLPPKIPQREWFIQRKYIDSSGLFEGSGLSKDIALKVLTKAPVFQGWNENTLKEIVKSLKERPITLYPAGSVIFLQGFTGSEMYILLHGRVQFSTKDQELAVFDAGENGFCFGEEGLFAKTKRRSNVRTLSPCQIIQLTAENFHGALDKNPADKMLLQLTHQKWKEHITKRNNQLYEEFGGALDMEILRMALKQTKYFSSCPSGFVYIIALSITVKAVQEEQAILSHKQYSEGHWLFLVLKGSAILVNDEDNTEQLLDVEQIFCKTSLSPANAWVKANEVSVVAVFPWSAVTEAQDVFPDVTLEQ